MPELTKKEIQKGTEIIFQGRFEVDNLTCIFDALEKVGDNTFNCSPGDKVVIPGNVEHEATAGPEGCVFFWSEKL